MNNYNPKPGYIYDTVAVLTRYLDDLVPHRENLGHKENCYYANIIRKLTDCNIVIPHYLYPFACRNKERRPLLASLLLDSYPYVKYSGEHAKTILENNQYLRRRFVEYFFDTAGHRRVFEMAEEHPAGIDLLKLVDSASAVYIHYTLIHFDEVSSALSDVFQRLYAVVENEHKEFVIKNPDFVRSFQAGVNMEKLKTLANLQEPPRFSVSLITPDIINTKADDPGFFLLGHMCGEVLNTRHKYLNATPYSFAEAIGNPVRYDIYRALLTQSPMTRSEMEKKLNMSRGSLDHNLEVMRVKGLLVVDHQTGQTFHYRLDPEYIRAAAECLMENVRSL